MHLECRCLCRLDSFHSTRCLLSMKDGTMMIQCSNEYARKSTKKTKWIKKHKCNNKNDKQANKLCTFFYIHFVNFQFHFYSRADYFSCRKALPHWKWMQSLGTENAAEKNALNYWTLRVLGIKVCRYLKSWESWKFFLCRQSSVKNALNSVNVFKVSSDPEKVNVIFHLSGDVWAVTKDRKHQQQQCYQHPPNQKELST